MLEVGDLAEVIGELVSLPDVLDAVAQLDHVALVEARKVNVEGARRRVRGDGRVVGGALAALDGFVDLAILAVDARGAELDDLAVGLVAEAVFARGGGRFVGERLEDDLVKAGSEVVLEDRGHDEIAQRASIVTSVRRLALLEEALGGPRVLLVGTGLRRLDVLDVFAHVFFLRP